MKHKIGAGNPIRYKRGEEALNSVTRELSELHKAETQGFVYRVHEPLRNVNSKAYDPEILAIGPYHRDKDKYKMMKEHKLRYLQSILNRREETTAMRYISAVAEMEEEARSCYVEPINLSQDNFIKMLVLDGCFIIELVRKFEKADITWLNDPIFAMEWIRGGLRMGLILFENQIPFFILCKMFNLIEGPNQHARLIDLLLSFCRYLLPDQECKRQKIGSLHGVKHFLDLIYNWWTPEPFDGAVDLNEDYPIPVNSESRFIHSVAELKDANVKFRKREPCDSLFEVKFQNGTVLMPPLMITDSTECFFRNLIAYEQYFRDDQNNYVTDYVKFIDLLINSSKDIDVLLKCGIIDSWLGDNEVIGNMFNKLTDSVGYSSKHAVRKYDI